jgi:hypothetical protein
MTPGRNWSVSETPPAKKKVMRGNCAIVSRVTSNSRDGFLIPRAFVLVTFVTPEEAKLQFKLEP